MKDENIMSTEEDTLPLSDGKATESTVTTVHVVTRTVNSGSIPEATPGPMDADAQSAAGNVSQVLAHSGDLSYTDAKNQVISTDLLSTEPHAGILGTFTVGRIAHFVPSHQLRFAVSASTTTEEPKLQQLWYDTTGSETEWRDVPRVVI